ncbi:MAG: YgiQ family radical SAM protein [Eubacteriaceae bacterium]|nr:YgiQ family radical SAM protein [Eubacteriaceae bacterium]
MSFLPISKKEMNERGWEQADFIIITGDAYVDHPSFGTAIIGRVLEHYGYKVAVLPQPDWRSTDDFKKLGRPRLGFLINSGNVDSMVNHFSVFKHRRKKDVYSPGGISGKRPDRAVIVYSNRAKEAYHDAPIMIGGLEASLRRLAHYDYWEDTVRRSILLDSRADILLYGMGERAVIEIAEALDSGLDVKDIGWIRGTCVKSKDVPAGDAVMLPGFDSLKSDRKKYAESFAIQYKNHDSITAKTLVEQYDEKVYVVQNPPQPPLERMEMDDVYDLPYERTYHPSYEEQGGVPAVKEVRFSIVQNRGCFGGCAFCALTYHQGRQVRSRSRESVVREAEIITKMDDFKGYIHDIGGPTADFTSPACKKQTKYGVCMNKDCLYPKPCSEMIIDHSEYLETLREVRKLPGIKKVFIRSGIRYDYLIADKDRTFFEELCKYHISGTLKVAPEHTSPHVLAKMRKPACGVFEKFTKEYAAINRKIGKEQYLIPYLISSHPGSDLSDAVDMALYLKRHGFVPDQVQDFYPTPSTLATCMYYTGFDPLTGESVYAARDIKEKKMQRALLHFNKRENRDAVMQALKVAGREEAADELVGKTGRNNRKGQR